MWGRAFARGIERPLKAEFSEKANICETESELNIDYERNTHTQSLKLE